MHHHAGKKADREDRPACTAVRCESSALPGRFAWGEAKVYSGRWVLIEDVAVGDATNGTVSAKRVSIPSWLTRIALAEATGSVAAATGSAVAATGSVAARAAAAVAASAARAAAVAASAARAAA